MTWGRPYQIYDKCEKLKKLCQPLQEGCVLERKVGQDKSLENSISRKYDYIFRYNPIKQR